MSESRLGPWPIFVAMVLLGGLGTVYLVTRVSDENAGHLDPSDNELSASDKSVAPSVSDDSSTNPDSYSASVQGREGVVDSVLLRVFGGGAPQADAEVVVVPWDESWSSRIRRPDGVPTNEISSRVLRVTCDATGVARIPRSGAILAIAARARGFAPAARWAQPADAELDLNLEPGFGMELRALNHDNEHVPEAIFEASFDSRYALALDPDIGAEILITLPQFRSTAVADSDRIGRIRDLAPGPYRVLARHAMYADSVSWGLKVPTVRRPYDLSLEPRAFVDGFVRRKSDGLPLAGARIDIRHFVGTNFYGNSCDAVTGEDGYFMCDNAWGSPLGDLDGRATCWRDGYGVQTLSYGFPKPGERQRLEFLLDGAAPFHGRVEDIDGNPRGGIEVSAGENQLNLETTTSRADGSFTLHTLAKDYAFHFGASGSCVGDAAL